MAFTAAQKKDIRKYLGVPFGFYDLNYRLESMMDKVGADATDSAEVVSWLTELGTIETAISGGSSSAVTYGALKKVDEVEFHPPSESGSATTSPESRGRALIMRLARAFGVDDVLPNGDYFSGSMGGGGMLALG